MKDSAEHLRTCDVDNLLSFVRLTNRLSGTERFISHAYLDRKENVAEHSAQLGLTAWFLAERYALKLDRGLLLEYALIHDIVEANTGDFPTHLPDFDRNKKAVAEAAAAEELEESYPEVEGMWKIYHRYSNKEDPESQFVYALDKLLPAINIYLASCKEWKMRGSKELRWYFADLTQRMALSPIVRNFWAELLSRIEEEYPEMGKK